MRPLIPAVLFSLTSLLLAGPLQVPTLQLDGKAYTACKIERSGPGQATIRHAGGTLTTDIEKLPATLHRSLGQAPDDKPATPPKLPTFRSPAACARIPAKHGIPPTGQSAAGWTTDTLGWYHTSSLTTHKGGLTKVGDVDNTITCHLSSSRQDRIETLAIKANCFNPAGEAATLARFKAAAQAILKDLGITRDIFKAPATEGASKVIVTDTYILTLDRQPFKIGYGYVLKLTTTF